MINKINPILEWIFEDPDTITVEKLDVTNTKLKTEKGRLIVAQNRLNVIDSLKLVGDQVHVVDGILRSAAKGLIDR